MSEQSSEAVETDGTETEIEAAEAEGTAQETGVEAEVEAVDPAAEGDDSVEDQAEGDEDADEAADDSDEAPKRSSRVQRLEAEGDIAADYLEELLDIADLDGDLDMDVEGDRAMVSVVGADLHQLVGRDGEVLEALQELTRLAVYRETGERSRLMLDVSGHRAARRESLEALAAERIAEVRESGQSVSLEPMSAFERKVVHDVVSAAGMVSESEGAEPKRHVVILPPA